MIFGAVVGCVLLGIGWYAYQMFFSPSVRMLERAEYVAVFLDTNQVFFGHVDTMDDEHVVLSRVYYLQQSPTSAEDFVLMKSGAELHGPRDEMVVSQNHILLIQPLRPDSQVISTIAEFEAGQQ